MAQVENNSSFIQRVGEIPLVNDGLNNAQYLIQSNSYSSAVYNKAGEYATSIYKSTEPYQQRWDKEIKQVDQVLNKGLDYVQAKVPYPFQVHSDELIQKARAPADQAIAVASTYTKAVNERISPITEPILAQVNKTLETIRPLQEKLQASLASVKDQAAIGAAEAQNKVQATSNSIIQEVDGLITYLKTQSTELPAHVQASFKPLLEKLGSGYNDIKTELSQKDVPPLTKAQHLLTYSKDNAIPLINEAAASLKELVSRKATEAKDATGQAEDSAKETYADVTAKYT